MFKTGNEIFGTNKDLAGRLDDVVERLVREFKPERIILFGSYARCDYQETSTMDLLVIAQTESRFVTRIRHALNACSGGLPPIEPLIYTPEEFDQLLNVEKESYLIDAMEEGIVVYEKGES